MMIKNVHKHLHLIENWLIKLNFEHLVSHDVINDMPFIVFTVKYFKMLRYSKAKLQIVQFATG